MNEAGLEASEVSTNKPMKLSSERSDSRDLTTAQYLPNEILCEIFAHCLPDDPLENPQPDISIAPLLLCRVCSSWRNIAIHTPQLWTNVGLSLEYAYLRLGLFGGAGFPEKKLAALRMWAERMGVLPPSISLRRFHNRVDYDKAGTVVYQDEFFRNPTLRSAQSLDLNGFSESDLHVLIGAIHDFPNLRTLVVREPGGREHNLKRLRFPSTPLLRRLYFDCFVERGPSEDTIKSMFSWSNITHLCANLEVYYREWRVILTECTSLTHAAFNLRLLGVTPSTANGQPGVVSDRDPIVRSTIRALIIQATGDHLELAFAKLFFSKLTVLRICSRSSGMVPFDTLHKVLSSTPFVTELHLRSCIGFGHRRFLDYTSSSTFPVTLRTYVPDLDILVIDGMGIEVNFLPRDIFKLLDSEWLNRGWSEDSKPKRRLDFLLNLGQHFTRSVIDEIRCQMVAQPHPHFDVQARYEPGGLWKWAQLRLSDIEADWGELMKFYTLV